jgi:N-acetylglucosaminyldiphosphoundecaprenol N-acetyl-beta-D-mannosaminyltransferase
VSTSAEAVRDERRAGLSIGRLWVDAVTFPQAVAAVERLVERKKGGRVFTPNVDHVVMAEHDERFAAAYSRADLSLADGLPLVAASGLLGVRLPERVSGSDLVVPLMERAAARDLSVYFLGGAPGVAEKARQKLLEQLPTLRVVGVDAPMINVDGTPEERAMRLKSVTDPIRAAKPDLVLVALGAPKQELFIDQVADELAPSVFLGIGASLDFIAGTVQRAPPWARKVGLEWAHRLVHDPVRLWRRYVIRDSEYPLILLRQLRQTRRSHTPTRTP